MNGRLNRLYRLRGLYRNAVNAVASVAERKTNADILTRGLRFARAQRQFNLELADRRRVAARTGTPMGVATQVPTTSPQYLGLILAEQRQLVAEQRQLVAAQGRVANALEALVPLATAIVCSHLVRKLGAC